MFARARRRLTLLYIGMFALVLGAFSVVLYVGSSIVLSPSFDIGPELTSEQVEEVTYHATVDRIATALVVADVVVLVVVGIAAWLLASWTLRPIADAHRRQQRFVADASHEMSTPLAAIRATAETALQATAEPRAGLPSPDEARTALATILAATERLSRLTTDLLVLARADERLIEPHRDAVDLSVVTAEAVEAFATADRSSPRPVVKLTPDLRVLADADELGRVVMNLIDNAYRYGGVSVAVNVTTRGAEGDAILDVADDGPGIEPADAGKVFEPFYRVHAHAGSPTGSGLGLAIARSLAERNGGRLTLVSTRGVGATFRLALPRVG